MPKFRYNCLNQYMAYHKKNLKSNSHLEAEKHKLYIDERKSLIDTANKSALLFVQTMVTLAAGSFGLSFIFIKQVVPIIKPDTKWLLSYSWICYCITILSTLFSLFFSQHAHLRQIKILEQTYFPDEKSMLKNYHDKFVAILTIISILSFTAATGFLAYFGIKNIEEEGPKMESRITTGQNTNKTTVPTSPTTTETRTPRPPDPPKPPPKK